MQVKNSTRLAFYDKYYQNVYANGSVLNNGTVAIGAYRDDTKRENLINQTDITYTAKTGNIEHKLLAGAEFAVQNTENKRLTPTGGEGAPGSVSATNPTVSNVAFTTVSRNQKSDFTVSAFYLQDQIVFNPHWQAVVGLRHDHIDTDYTNVLSNSQINTSDNLLSPRAGLIFKPTQDSSVYVNYSTSYVPRAGDQLIGLTVNNATFKPEKFINKEVGAKWDITPSLALTAAVFKLERENVLAADPSNTGNSILLDGQETTGLELGASGKVTDQWQIMGAFTLQDGEITERQANATAANVINKGAALAMTPTRTFSLWNKYQINDTWAIALGMVSRSEMYAATPTVGASTILPGYTRFDAAIFAKISPQWDAQINIENLTNKDYALYAHNNNNITPGAPLNARATLNYHF